MKNSIQKTGLSCGIVFLLFSCEQDIIVELKPHTPSLVVHGYVATGDTFVIAVGKTTNSTIISPNADTYVNNAIAVLYENGVKKDTMDYNPTEFRYTSPVVAVSGKTYKIVVEAPGYTTVEATALVPALVNTTIVSFVKNARLDINANSLSDVTFRFADPPSEKNYYLAELGSTFTSSFCVYSYDASIEQYQGGVDPFETSSCIGNKEILIKDDLFNGTTKNLTLSGNSWAMEEMDLSGHIVRPYLKKYSISKDFYEYIKDGISIDVMEGNPFAEPHMTGGNVRNGYGLFTVYSATVDTLR